MSEFQSIFLSLCENAVKQAKRNVSKIAFFIDVVLFFNIKANALRLCVRAGFLPLHLIRRTELKYTQKASDEALKPA
jgi:hypothetical protein